MISVIVPILNEAETIESLLQHLCDTSSLETISEIIIVDGGSSDGSQEVLMNFLINKLQSGPIIKLLNSEKGRAIQMNYGARNAHGTILYFLHADSFPPKDFDTLIINEVNKGNMAGCFRMQFDSKHWWLCLASWMTRFNWRACRGGDQSQFITKELFEEIGGYDESYPIYEDNILISALYDRNQFVVIPKILKTSSRLYKKHGIWKLQYHFGVIYFKRWQGAEAKELFAYYKKHI